MNSCTIYITVLYDISTDIYAHTAVVLATTIYVLQHTDRRYTYVAVCTAVVHVVVLRIINGSSYGVPYLIDKRALSISSNQPPKLQIANAPRLIYHGIDKRAI